LKTDRSNRKLKINIISNSIYQILVMVVPILTTPYVTRIFDVGQMGEYNLSLMIASLCVIVSQFGLESYGVREIAQTKTKIEENKKFFQLHTIQTTASILMFIIYNLLSIFILNVENKQLYFVQSFLILVNIFDISWYFTGVEEIRKIILRNALSKIFVTLSIFVLIKDSDQLSFYALINVLGMLLGNFTMIFSSKQYIDYSYLKFSTKKQYILGSFRLLLPRLLNAGYGTVETSVLQIATTAGNVGIYSEAKRIINLSFSVIKSAFSALSPRMSFHVSRNEFSKVQTIFQKGLMYCSFFAIILVSGIQAVSTYFVDFFFGPGYEMVAVVLQIASFGLVFIPIISLISSDILVPIGKDKEYTTSILIILISGTILNFILDPRFGAIGAAIAFAFTQMFCLIYLTFITRRIIRSIKIMKSILITFLAIILNIIIINRISVVISMSNPFVAFLFFGTASVLLSGIFILGYLLIMKFYFKLRK